MDLFDDDNDTDRERLLVAGWTREDYAGVATWLSPDRRTLYQSTREALAAQARREKEAAP